MSFPELPDLFIIFTIVCIIIAGYFFILRSQKAEDESSYQNKGVFLCNYCLNITNSPLQKGTLGLGILLLFFALPAGVLYLLWRSGPADVCPKCGKQGVIPILPNQMDLTNKTKRLEKKCQYCAEIILEEAIICKHCKMTL